MVAQHGCIIDWRGRTAYLSFVPGKQGEKGHCQNCQTSRCSWPAAALTSISMGFPGRRRVLRGLFFLSPANFRSPRKIEVEKSLPRWNPRSRKSMQLESRGLEKASRWLASHRKLPKRVCFSFVQGAQFVAIGVRLVNGQNVSS